jgi:hypothetical protein
MKLKRVLVGSLIAFVLTLSVVAIAQVNRPYRNATVWSIGFIRSNTARSRGTYPPPSRHASICGVRP